MKPVHAVYRAGYTDYDGLDTYRAIPTRNVPIEALEPFIFLNHHGPQVYPAGNKGLPFGPHPHKGFETVTVIVEGDLVHKDSTGYTSNIKKGGIQWMTAGKGIIHSETSSDVFLKEGGTVEILQLWVNLPGKLKNAEPHYVGLQKEEIPQLELEEGNIKLNLISGNWYNKLAPIQSLSDVQLATVAVRAGSVLNVSIPANRTVLLYVIKGKVLVNDAEAEAHEVVEFAKEGTDISIKAAEDALVLLGHAAPNGEPIVAHGPFVMNTQEEIRQAFVEYQQGKLGVWQG